MKVSGAAARLALSLTLALIAVPPASAQSPVVGDFVLVNVNIDEGSAFVEVPYLGTTTIDASVTDLSRDSVQEAKGNEKGLSHQVFVEVVVMPYHDLDGVGATNGSAANETMNVTGELANSTLRGWSVSGGGVFSMTNGETRPFPLQIKNAGEVAPNFVRVRVTARTRDPYQGVDVVDSQDIIAKLAPFYAGRVLIRSAPPTVGQNDLVNIPIEISNFNTYRDVFLLNASAPSGFFVAIPPRVVLEPRETRILLLQVQTPHDSLFELGRTGTIFVHARSVNDPKAVYTAPTQVLVYGPYVPPYWWPVFLLGVLGAVVVARDTRERALLRRGEKNLPRRPRPSPREVALLQELRRRDREAWKARVTGYDSLYGERRQVWKEHRRDELAEERAERRESHLQAKERRAKEKELAEKRRALEKTKAKRDEAAKAVADKEAAARAKADKREAKLGAKLQKKQAKIDAKRAKVEAKERAKLEKALAKKRKELEALARKKAKELEKARKKGG